ncbi:MAG: hypothetical protein GTO53_06775 [Planctomycetales bacterium]|nr:hypothetical protein [Planctomycetales bacterium]NIM08841.1 hypothetical protein [Planctomycetales bacterium]NIN08302.1 hypothetical protein [Planctomycetales bacterium]NIN77431.1 hypothetical protein [Planctomycetales bacterium]NIO34605.1 hypothetical protein [Planctomycetales bacterium]
MNRGSIFFFVRYFATLINSRAKQNCFVAATLACLPVRLIAKAVVFADRQYQAFEDNPFGPHPIEAPAVALATGYSWGIPALGLARLAAACRRLAAGAPADLASRIDRR